MKIKAIIKRADETVGHMTNISNTLENLQRTVGGYIETLTLKHDPEDSKAITIICNEEGLINDMPYNCTLGGHQLFGDIIICGASDEDFADIPISFKEWKEKWCN